MSDPQVVEQVLTLPCFVAFLPFPVIRRWNELSKRFAHLVRSEPETLGYWSAMCQSLAAERGLYTIFDTPSVCPSDYATARRIFFDELWPQRDKWNNTGSGRANVGASNPVKISVRFRPEMRGLDNVNLPLHQFLKVQRAKVQAQAQAQAQTDQQKLLVGLEDPAEFLDPLLNTLMHDPVFVPTAKRICDRSVAITSILRGGRCPFSGRRLRAEQLEPQEELKARIAAWRVEKEEKTRDKSVALEDTKTLVEANTAVDPALLELTTEIERMALIADRAQREQASLLAKRGKGQGQNGTGDSSSSSSSNEEGCEGTDENSSPNVNAAASNHQEDFEGDLLGAVRAMGGSGIDLAGHDDCGMFSRSADKPRVLDVNPEKKCVSVCEPGAGVTAYHFNQVYHPKSSQQDVYYGSARSVLHSALNGLNATLLCYGQTGSGKTFTLHGPEGSLDHQNEEEGEGVKSREEEGLLLRALREAIQAVSILSLRRGQRVSLSCQYVEIFEETCSCLLSGAKCLVRRDSGEVSGAVEAPLSTLADCFEVLRTGQLRKRFAATAMNDHSSRSHTVFILHVLSARDGDTEEGDGAGEQMLLKSRAVLVDLAGSERVKKSLVAGARLKEAIGINNSLLVLGRVIAALASSASHVPYLESRLTTLLKSSFGGNSRTHVVTCCRQADAFGDETLWSLRFASRCSLVSNFSKTTASNAQAAAESLDASLASVKAQLEGMRRRGLDKMDSFYKLEASYRGLLLKRNELQTLRPASQEASGRADTLRPVA